VKGAAASARALSLAVLAASAGAQEPIGRIGVELEGPLDSVCLALGAVPTVLEVSVAAGERRRFDVPYVGSSRASAAPLLPRFLGEPPPAGASLVPGSHEPPPVWAELPRGLRNRSLPPLERARVAPDAPRWAALAAALLLVLGLRRRPLAALTVGAAAALGLLLWPAPPASGPLQRVLEGDAESGRWLEVRAARESLELADISVGWVRHLPSSAALRLELSTAAGAAAWRLVAAQARVFALREVAGRAPTRADPGAHDWRRLWLRDPAGDWSAHGPWKRGEVLPPPLAGAPAPPGWLAAGLPQGIGILVGELESGADERLWLRWVGFE
jgi:hypothetical protein